MEIKKRGTTFIIYRPDKKILMQLRDGGSPLFPNMWCFPGGTCEKYEEPIETVLREVYEESQLRLEGRACRLLTNHVPQYVKNAVDYIFLCSTDAYQEPAVSEGREMRWMDIEEIKKLKLGFEQESLVPIVENFLKSN